MSEISLLYDEIMKLHERIKVLSALSAGKKYYNVQEAAHYTTFSEDFIRKNAGRIKSGAKKGKRLIFTREELDSFMLKNV